MPPETRAQPRHLGEIRTLGKKSNEILITYVLSGAIFHLGDLTRFIATSDGAHIGIPIPGSYFKSILTGTNEVLSRCETLYFQMKNCKKTLHPFSPCHQS